MKAVIPESLAKQCLLLSSFLEMDFIKLQILLFQKFLHFGGFIVVVVVVNVVVIVVVSVTF